MSGTFNSPTGQFGYTPPSGLTSFGQTSGTPQIGSPLASPAERGAMEALLNIATGAGSSAQAGIGGPNPTGAPSTGNFGQDLAGFGQAAGQTALGMVANPTSLPGTVAGLMGAAAIRGMAGIPNPTTLGPALGMRGLAQAIQEAMFGLAPAEAAARTKAAEAAARAAAIEAEFGSQTGYGDKPSGLTAAEAAAQQAAAMATQDMGPSKASTEGTSVDAAASQGMASSLAGDPGGGQSGAQGAGGSGETYAGGGLVALAGGGKIARGPGSGLDDLIPTTIDGARPAALSDGEFVIPADVVSMFGDGSSNGGAQRLYDLVRAVRQNKTGSATQAGPLPIGDILKRSLR